MSVLAAFLSCCLLLIQGTAEAKHGTIGYGINMYLPYCCTACMDSISMLYLNCTTFSKSGTDDGGMSMKLLKRMDMDMAGSTSNECYATDIPYLETLAYCVQTHCDAEGLSYIKQNLWFRNNAAGGLSVPSLNDSLPHAPPTEQLEGDAMWLNNTRLVNEASWQADRQTIKEFESVEDDHVRFSITIMTLSVGIPLLTGLWLWMTAVLPTSIRQDGLLLWVQSTFTIPALLQTRHSQPLPHRLGYVPNRATSMIIILYLVLNIIFCSVPYKSIQPNSWYSNRNKELAAYVANRTGVLSFANMALAILFSTRNNPLMYLSGWSQTTFLALHRWAARMAIFQAVVHSIVYTADYCYYQPEGNTYAAQAVQPYWWWGIIATIAMSLMAGLSALPLRAYAYELFLVLHILLAILSLVGCWYHVDIRFGKNWGYEVWLYIAFAFWAFDRAVRSLKVVYYNFLSRTRTTAEMITGTNIVVLTIFPGKSWTGGPGQHTFVYFPALRRFWENHPFTIMDWTSTATPNDDSTDSTTSSSIEPAQKQPLDTTKDLSRTSSPSSVNERPFIRCMFRAHKGATATLHHSLLNSTNVCTLSALTEGPYGHLPPPTKAVLRNADKVICIAGGIGITYAAGFVKTFAEERMLSRVDSNSRIGQGLFTRCQDFSLVWSVREKELLGYVQENVLPQLESGSLDDGSLRYRFWLTGADSGHHPVDIFTSNDFHSSSSPSSSHETPARDEEITILSEKHKDKAILVPQVSVNPDPLITTQRGQRIDVAKMIAWETAVGHGKRVAILVCGPGGLADEVRYQVARVVRRGGLVDLIEETFAW